jgi:hypothetical protein
MDRYPVIRCENKSNNIITRDYFVGSNTAELWSSLLTSTHCPRRECVEQYLHIPYTLLWSDAVWSTIILNCCFIVWQASKSTYLKGWWWNWWWITSSIWQEIMDTGLLHRFLQFWTVRMWDKYKASIFLSSESFAMIEKYHLWYNIPINTVSAITVRKINNV